MQPPLTFERSTVEAIEALLTHYLASDNDAELVAAARRSHSLPVYEDVGGALLLHPKGTVFQFAWDTPNSLQEERDQKWILVALARASQKWAALASIRPLRGPQALDCPNCAGAGVFLTAGIKSLCGHCSGLGWVES